MTSRERVLTALQLKQPDRVPWVESSVHNRLAEKLLQRYRLRESHCYPALRHARRADSPRSPGCPRPG